MALWSGNLIRGWRFLDSETYFDLSVDSAAIIGGSAYLTPGAY